ncbi:MAG: ABC transporter ATP-binding protein [Halobacteriales archaeon]
MTSAVAASDVRKAYGGTTALRGVSLDVAPGEVLALIGPNGAGKTTLVRCLTGTTTPDAGTVSLLGTSPREADANRVGLLPQSFTPPARLTARELLAYYAGLYDDARAVDTVLGQVGLEQAAGTRYEDLSGGQRRRTLVGTALVNDPDVLFLDEPTTGIDPAGRRAVWSLVEALADGGTTVFLTTHSMGEAERLADRVGLLVAGELVASGTPAELVAEYGGGSRLVVETAAPEAARDALDHLEATVTDGAVVVERLPAGRVGEVVEALERVGVGFDRLAWAEPDLERVYLELAGGAADASSPAGDARREVGP